MNNPLPADPIDCMLLDNARYCDWCDRLFADADEKTLTVLGSVICDNCHEEMEDE